MPRKTQVNRKPQLRVIFDTNTVFSHNSSFLLNRSIGEFIAANSDHPDLSIHWHLPNIVVSEREYQMVNAARELLPQLEKLETLIGHKLGITQDEVSTRVNNAIEKQIKSHQIEVINLDADRVNWNQLIDNAVRRVAPFEPGKTEKGFRDAIVIETAFQLIEDSPTTPSICRIAIITNDGLVRQAALGRITGRSNVRILNTLDELQSLINILVSEVDETYVAEMQEKADKYFYAKDVATSLYLKQNIHEQISKHFKKQLKEIPKGADRRKNTQWFIWTPTFVSKVGQRTWWNTKITVNARAYKTIEATSPSFNIWTPRQETDSITSRIITTLPNRTKIYPDIIRNTPLSFNPSTNPSTLTLRAHGRGTESEVTVLEGVSTFQVTWSVTVNTRKQLTSPNIDEIKFIDTQWQPK